MQNTTLLLILAAMGVAAFFFGRVRSLELAGGPGNIRSLHSLPGYYGYFTLIWSLLPGLFLMLLWVFLEPKIIVALVVGDLPEAQQALSAGELNLLVNNIQNLAYGDAISGTADSMLRSAAASFTAYSAASRQLLSVLAIAVALLGGF